MSRIRAASALTLVVALAVLVATLAARTAGVEPPRPVIVDPSVDDVTGTTAFEFPTSPPGALRLASVPVSMKNNRAQADTVYSTAAVMIYDADVEPVEVTAWAPIGPDGLRVTGVGLVLDDGFGGGYGGDKGYPPPGRNMGKGLHDIPAVVHPVGHVLDLDAPFTPGNTYFVVVGYALEPGHRGGSVEGIRLTYSVGGDEDELNVPIRLELCEEPDMDKPCR